MCKFKNITMQREASMKECTSNFPAQDKNGLAYLCMHIGITTWFIMGMYGERKLCLMKNHILLRMLVFFYMPCNVHTQQN